MTDGERKITLRDAKVVPRTILYDPDLTLGLPAAVSAASGNERYRPLRRSVVGDSRTPVTVGLATEAMRRFGQSLPAVVADGANVSARADCLIAAWLAGTVLNSGTALQHKLAHVLGGLGLPHAEAHAIILPHVTRFDLEAAPEARVRLEEALVTADPAGALSSMLNRFPIPERLREIGFDRGKADFVATRSLPEKSPRHDRCRQMTFARAFGRLLSPPLRGSYSTAKLLSRRTLPQRVVSLRT